MDNYNTIPQKMKYQQTIRHGSCSADMVADEYNIYSYNTLMATIKKGKVVYFNDKHYSRTTSRLQNIIKDVFNIQ